MSFVEAFKLLVTEFNVHIATPNVSWAISVEIDGIS